ncbi:MAG: ATP-binding protein [Campylobacterales bacterium]|nr:ATP-binding protein [Campylobacterales bacterium]
MKFYNREQELEKLRSMEARCANGSKMTVVVGRRRIGKTKLIKEAFAQKVYLFVSKKSEALLCEEFIAVFQNTLDIKILGTFTKFKDLFELMMVQTKERAITVVIDEFQEFLHINPSVYSDMQNIWDEYKEATKMNLVLSGSIYSLMKKIFEDQKEPLFGRADAKIHLQPFRVDTLKAILSDHRPSFSNEDLLSFYLFTGGVAKYVELFVDAGAFTQEKMLDLIFSDDSLLLEEGKNLLIEEFGKEYTTYFSILSLIASSKTSRSAIESILERNIGGYLDRLEHEYTVIRKIKPILAKEGSRTQKYEISDNFFNFWFRFVYKNRSAVEIGNYGYVRKLVERDYTTYAGKFLERYFIDRLKVTQEYSLIGTYWERNNDNEIDIVAINELEKKLLIAEVKLNPKKIDIDQLKNKSLKLIGDFKAYAIEYRGLSIDDM